MSSVLYVRPNQKGNTTSSEDGSHSDYRRIGTPFEVSPERLREALSQACGPDPGHYVRKKQAQLEQLGFGEDRYQLEALFRIEDLEHLNDITLGIRPLKPERLSVFESRFGILMPLEDSRFADIEHILIQPPTMGTCQIVIRGPALSLPATFTAQAVVGAPIIEEDGPHLLLKNPDIELRLRAYRLDLQTVGEFQRVNRTLERWIQLVRALGYLTGGRGSLSIRNLAQISDLTLPLSQALDGPDVHLPNLSTVLEGWQELLKRAGVNSTAEFNLETIWAARSVITAVDVLLHSANSSSFEFSDQPALEDYPLPIQALYYNRASLGDASVCFAARVSIHRTQDPTYPYRSTAAEMLDVRPDTDDLDGYAEEQATENATENALRIIIDPDNIDWVGRFHEE